VGIPPRIFQTWKHKYQIPVHLKQWSDSFVGMNPGFRYELWDDVDNRKFIKKQFPWFLETYDAYEVEICRVDAVRYFYLYSFGGIYVDMDTECLRPLDGILPLADVVLGRMGQNPQFLHSVPNAIMASKPHQEFWLLVIELLRLLSRESWRPEGLTGSIILKAAVDIYLAPGLEFKNALIEAVRQYLREDQQPEPLRSNIVLLDSGAWFPLDWTNSEHVQLCASVLSGDKLDLRTKTLLCRDAWMVTYWNHSWE
jgi:inositol phosphorylceramide mannosyltransferase catalytic subunit